MVHRRGAGGSTEHKQRIGRLEAMGVTRIHFSPALPRIVLAGPQPCLSRFATRSLGVSAQDEYTIRWPRSPKGAYNGTKIVRRWSTTKVKWEMSGTPKFRCQSFRKAGPGLGEFCFVAARAASRKHEENDVVSAPRTHHHRVVGSLLDDGIRHGLHRFRFTWEANEGARWLMSKGRLSERKRAGSAPSCSGTHLRERSA